MEYYSSIFLAIVLHFFYPFIYLSSLRTSSSYLVQVFLSFIKLWDNMKILNWRKIYLANLII